MVNLKIQTYLLFILITSQSFAKDTLSIAQKDVAELILKQGHKTEEINLKYQQYRLAPVQTLSNYDWKLTADTGFEYDKSATFQTSDSKYERLTSNFSLTKPFMTGTTMSLTMSRLSQKATFGTYSSLSASTPAEATLDTLGVTIEQSLWSNSMGKTDQALIESAQKQFESNLILRADELQNIVLDSIRQFWTTYVKEENFKESMAARDRYKTLVDTVKRKNSFGYSNPGELSQVQAELEGKEQSVRQSSIDYLLSLENLKTLLNIPQSTELKFSVPSEIPQAPQLDLKPIENLRPIKSQALKIESAQNAYQASKSKDPTVFNLVGKVYSTGEDKSPETSYSNLASGSNPKYYLGVKFAYTFGSDFQTEDIINKKSSLNLEETKMARTLNEYRDKEAQAMRRVQALYGIAISSQKQKGFREKTVSELNRSYNQGRTDLKTLIDAMNAFFASEIQYSQSLGNYYIALNEWAAIRDELIPEKSN